MRHRFRIALALGLTAYAGFVAFHTSPAAAGSDSAGYLLSAKLLSQGHLTAPLRTVPGFSPVEVWEHTPLGMIYSERAGALVPTYPIGLPLAYAAAAALAGWTLGPLLVATLMACAGTAATFACARQVGVRRELAAVAAVALAACPITLFATFQPLSDAACACLATVAVTCGLRAAGRGSLRWGLAAGAAFAGAVLLRPSAALLLPALLAAMPRPRLLGAAFLGGLPGALLLGWYHHTLYGSVVRTGYGSIWDIFGPEHVLPSLHQYLVWVPAFLPLGAAAVLLLPWLPWRGRPREITVLLLWILGFFAFYAFYPPTHESRWFLRFVLPAFPALLTLAVLAIEAILVPLPTARCILVGRTAVLLALAASLATGVYHWHTEHLGRIKSATTEFREVVTWADEALSPDAVILTFHATGSFYVYTDRPIVRSDNIPGARFEALKAFARAEGRPVYAVLAQVEERSVLHQRLPGPWTPTRRFGSMAVWQLAAPPSS